MWFSACPSWSVALALVALPVLACGGAGGSTTADSSADSAGSEASSSGDGSSGSTTGDSPTTGSHGTTTDHATSDTGGSDSAGATTGTSLTTGPESGTETTTDASRGTDSSTGAETTTDTGGEPGSRCEETATTITCPKITVELGPWQRDVHYQVPLGDPPAEGWPAVLMFQGSFFSAEITWIATDDLPFGAFYQTHVVKQLLDHGYAVITPEAKLDGGTFWDTNVPPYSLNWESSEDHELMLAVFAAIDEGTFGPVDAAHLFATGISSGGYMTSRMSVSYPGKFRALAIAAGSYATCSGPLCNVPDLDDTHPPTLFLHGEIDVTVPIATAEAYYDELLQSGVDARFVTDPDEGHGWIPVSPQEVLTWFDEHP